jgi:hypothetical protein
MVQGGMDMVSRRSRVERAADRDGIRSRRRLNVRLVSAVGEAGHGSTA